MSNWLLSKISNFFIPSNNIVKDHIANSKKQNIEARRLLNQFKAHLDREDYWFTCECSEKPKEPIKNDNRGTLCNSSSSHNVA